MAADCSVDFTHDQKYVHNGTLPGNVCCHRGSKVSNYVLIMHVVCVTALSTLFEIPCTRDALFLGSVRNDDFGYSYIARVCLDFNIGIRADLAIVVAEVVVNFPTCQPVSSTQECIWFSRWVVARESA